MKNKKTNTNFTKRQINNKKIIENKQVKKRKKFRIKFGVIFMLVLFLTLLGTIIFYIFQMKITNIYIKGNDYLSDQTIIEIANIQNYPQTFKNSCFKLKNNLEQNIYIKKAKVTKKMFTQVYITIEENRPLFYNQLTSKTILLDGQSIDEKLDTPILINNIPDSMYGCFIEKMRQIKTDVLNKISEIKYAPDEVDEKRFLFSMTDYNYVYLTLNKLDNINDYNNIVKQFDNKKGILYLNSGGYFEIKE